jgi:large subunit ribosomal protein L1
MENTEENKPKRRRPGQPNRRPSSKRHLANVKKVDKTKRYTLEEAVALLKEMTPSKFNETVEIMMKLGIDPKKSDQMVRGSVSLPKGIGKEVKVLVFAEGDMAEAAKKAGADFVGSTDLVDKIITENWMDFDVAIAHPNMMRYLSKLGKVLGPKGKMPSPKAGTVTTDVAKAVVEFKAGKVEFRSDNGGNVHAPVGKINFVAEDLVVNINTFIEHIRHIKPATSKGAYIQKIVVSSSMGPGIPLEIKQAN